METYQAIYDAVRSRITNGDVGNAVESAVRDAGISRYVERAAAEVAEYASRVSDAHCRPSAVYRPILKIDGDQWCALYGDNLQDGVAGFGDTPSAAMRAFDKEWESSSAKDQYALVKQSRVPLTNSEA